MRPEDRQPPKRPTMGDILPRPRYTRPTEGLLPPTPAASHEPVLPPVVPPVPSSHVHHDPDVTHMIEPPHHPALEAHSEVPLEPPVSSKDDATTKRPRKRRGWLIVLVVVFLLAVLAAGGAVGVKMWYDAQLQPVAGESASRIRVTIEPGSTPDQIGKLLREKGVIRSDIAFSFYTKEKGVQGQLQAGTYSLKPSESMAAIVSHLVDGKTDEFSMTFLPGDTLANNREKFLKAGYSKDEVDTALSKAYDHPALASKPATADLEGYIYGETYNFTGDATPEQILERTFDEFEKQIVQYDLVNAYKKQGLTLYQGITLASIIQREVANESDEKQVAQVFYKRLKDGMPLGSDVTFIYAAKKMGVTPTPDLDSPYNTRIHKGLPPGPIATPGLSALLAVAAPASGDYNYFLAGDDGKTYFAHTYDEHEANIKNHCQKGCQ